MRILVEILHPAHVHFFRHAVSSWRERGDQVLVLSRDKEIANHLLDAYDIPYVSISKQGRGGLGMIREMLVRDWRMFRHARRFRPDVLVGIMGVTIAQVGWLIRRPAIVFYDTEHATLTNRFVYPLAHSVCTPECYTGPVNGNHVTYPGYHELAYLHPDRFTPNPAIVRAAGIDPDQPYFLLRFVSWQASHDLKQQHFDLDAKRELIRALSEHGRVLISSESPLPDDLASHRFQAAPELIHHFIAFAKLVAGDSGTMSSEAAMLGVPAVYISNLGLGYLRELQERYGLVFNYVVTQADRAVRTAIEIAKLAQSPRQRTERREALLAERIDTTAWLMKHVERVSASAGTAP